MKTACFTLFFIAHILLISSCSSTEQFARTLPQNKITGNGFGHGVTLTTRSDFSSTIIPTDNVTMPGEAEDRDAIKDLTLSSAASTEKLHVKCNKKLHRFITNYLAKYPNQPVETNYNRKEALMAGIYDKIISKYIVAGHSDNQDQSKRLDIIAFVMGILAFGTSIAAWFLSVIFPPVGIFAFFLALGTVVAGSIAVKRIKQGAQGKLWLAIAGTVLGSLALLSCIILAIAYLSIISSLP